MPQFWQHGCWLRPARCRPTSPLATPVPSAAIATQSTKDDKDFNMSVFLSARRQFQTRVTRFAFRERGGIGCSDSAVLLIGFHRTSHA